MNKIGAFTLFIIIKEFHSLKFINPINAINGLNALLISDLRTSVVEVNVFYKISPAILSLLISVPAA